MQKTIMKSQTVQILHYPTLKTVLKVENAIREAKEPITRYEIRKRLGFSVMPQTLDYIIEYLDKKGIVLDSEKGIIWTYIDPAKLKKWLKEGRQA